MCFRTAQVGCQDRAPVGTLVPFWEVRGRGPSRRAGKQVGARPPAVAGVEADSGVLCCPRRERTRKQTKLGLQPGSPPHPQRISWLSPLTQDRLSSYPGVTLPAKRSPTPSPRQRHSRKAKGWAGGHLVCPAWGLPGWAVGTLHQRAGTRAVLGAWGGKVRPCVQLSCLPRPTSEKNS